MAKLDRAVRIAEEHVGVGMPMKGERRTKEQVAGFLELTHHEDPTVRRVAIRNLCPCHIQGEVDQVWDRLFEMAADPDEGVRHEVLHTMVDGSPRSRRLEVVEALERFAKDRGLKRSRRQFVNDALRRYHRTGQLDPHKR
jgi:hypothetical protein